MRVKTVSRQLSINRLKASKYFGKKREKNVNDAAPVQVLRIWCWSWPEVERVNSSTCGSENLEAESLLSSVLFTDHYNLVFVLYDRVWLLVISEHVHMTFDFCFGAKPVGAVKLLTCLSWPVKTSLVICLAAGCSGRCGRPAERDVRCTSSLTSGCRTWSRPWRPSAQSGLCWPRCECSNASSVCLGYV